MGQLKRKGGIQEGEGRGMAGEGRGKERASFGGGGKGYFGDEVEGEG